jgi:hypothetical protein
MRRRVTCSFAIYPIFAITRTLFASILPSSSISKVGVSLSGERYRAAASPPSSISQVPRVQGALVRDCPINLGRLGRAPPERPARLP